MVYTILLRYWDWTLEEDVRPLIFLMSDRRPRRAPPVDRASSRLPRPGGGTIPRDACRRRVGPVAPRRRGLERGGPGAHRRAGRRAVGRGYADGDLGRHWGEPARRPHARRPEVLQRPAGGRSHRGR